jgi:uncharacterized membrane protein
VDVDNGYYLLFPMFDVPLHPLVVHFPIALSILAAGYDVWAYSSKRPELHATGYRLTLWAAAGALVAVGSGLQFMGGVGFDNSRTAAHAGAGIIAGISATALAILRYSAHVRHPESKAEYPMTWLVLEVFAAVAVAVAAIMGHRLGYFPGV